MSLVARATGPTKYILMGVLWPISQRKAHVMGAFVSFMSWLFGTRPGVICLVLGGIVLFLLIAFGLERKTRREFYNHERTEDDWDLFDDEDDE